MTSGTRAAGADAAAAGEAGPPMVLRILLPHRELAVHTDVLRIVAETPFGAYGLLPRRLDCVLVLTPGVLTIETAAGGERFVAVDDGTLVKAGRDVLVSVRRAMAGEDLAALRAAVRREYLDEASEARELRAVLAKLETGFLKRFAELTHG